MNFRPIELLSSKSILNRFVGGEGNKNKTDSGIVKVETRPTTAFRKVSNSISSEEALVPISDEKEDKLAAARHWNYLGKIVYLVLYLMFNLVFWIIALTEYVRPAEEYINGNNKVV